MPLTDANSVVVQALVELLEGDWATIGTDSKKDIYYGDQPLYPRFPSLAVEPSPQTRELNQTGLQQRIRFSMGIMAFSGGLKGMEKRKKEADELAQRVVTRLHTDRTLGGLVIHGHATGVQPGFAQRGGALLVVHLITWDGISNFTMP